MLIMWTLVGALALVLVVKFMMRKKYKLPPGPSGLPFIGNMYQFDKDLPQETLTEWSEEFGDVFKYKIMGQDTIVLNDFKTIYEAAVTRATIFAGRMKLNRMKILLNHTDDISFTTFSPKWVYMKKTAMQALKMYGDNLENLEMITLDLIDDMMKELKEAAERGPVDMFPLLHTCISGIMTSILYGYKVEPEKLKSILVRLRDGAGLIQRTGPGAFLDIFPWMKHFPNKVYAKLVNIAERTVHWLAEEVENRRALHEQGNPLCVVDYLLDQQEMAVKKQAQHILLDGDIYGINNNLIVAGTVTTSITTYAFIALMVNKPELQQKMADIIITELSDRTPRLSDRKALPYVDAAILETLRYSSILPVNMPHSTMEDTTINGYDIPKDTEVVFNLWKLHHNPEYWDDPWEFKPERFLDEDGSLVPADHINRKRLLAFGASRRVCPGETLAKNRLFLLITALLQKYQFLPAGPNEIPKHDPRDYKLGLINQPYNFNVKLVPRQSA